MDAPFRSPRVPLWLGILFAAPVLLGLAFGVLAWKRGDVWKARALEAVNEQLAGDLEVNSMTLSWWNGFPNISVDLDSVTLTSAEGDTAAAVVRVGLELDFWSVWGDQPQLTSVVMEGGRIAVLQDPTGRWNLLDLLASPSEEEDSTSAMTVGTVVLRSFDVTWRTAEELDGTLKIDRAKVTLPQDDRGLLWDVSASDARAHGPAFPDLHPADLRCSGSWSSGNEQDSWSSSGTLTLAGIETHWRARQENSGGWSAHLALPKVTQKSLELLWKDPPWRGMVSMDHHVAVEVDFRDGDLEVAWSTTEDAFQLAPQATGLTMALQGAASGEGRVRRSKGSWTWSVENALARGSGWEVAGNLRPLANSRIQFEGQASLDASTPFHAWLPHVPTDVQSVLPVSGTATAHGTAVWDLEQGLQNMIGALSFSQLAGKLDGQPYLVEAPELRMEKTSCSGDSIAVLWAGNDVELDIRNLSWSSGISGGPWTGDVHVRAQSLHVNPVLSWWEHSRREPASEARFLPDGSSLRVDIDSKVLEWDALRCTDLSSRTKINHNRWVIQSASIQGLEGHAHVEGSLGPGRAGWLLSLRGTADDVSLPKLFSTYNNFGQDLIRHDHLGGALSTAGNLGMSWDLAGDWHGEDFTASLQTSIAHGRLTGLEVFEEVADYLEGHRLMAPLVDPNDLRQRLRDVSFEPVAQNLDVRGEKVWLPMTVIQSSAMNVAIEGEYRFDSTLDYTLGFALRDLRASAADSFGEMEDDGLGNQFFLRMSGPVEEPVYAYDRDAAREHRRRAIETEKNRLKDALSNRGDHAPEEATLPALEVEIKAPEPEPDRAPTEPQPSLRDRVRKPKGKKADDLLNPDDEDYL